MYKKLENIYINIYFLIYIKRISLSFIHENGKHYDENSSNKNNER